MKFIVIKKVGFYFCFPVLTDIEGRMQRVKEARKIDTEKHESEKQTWELLLQVSTIYHVIMSLELL